jgi:transcriptional regulator with XRE-family HTH domain
MNLYMLDKIKKAILEYPEKNYQIANKLGISEQHLSRVLNGKKPLTQKLAKKLTTLDDFGFNEQEMLYPHLPLDIAGYYYTGLQVVPFKTSRPQLHVPTPINPNYFGVIYRGQSYETSKFHLPLKDGECMVFDGSFEKLKTIDPDAVGKLSIVENQNGELWCGWLDEMGKQSKKHNFNPLGSTAWVHFKVKWASTFVMAWNLCKLEGVDNLVQLD